MDAISKPVLHSFQPERFYQVFVPFCIVVALANCPDVFGSDADQANARLYQTCARITASSARLPSRCRFAYDCSGAEDYPIHIQKRAMTRIPKERGSDQDKSREEFIQQ